MANEPRVLVIVLAGGEGKRLLPLTNDRAKPAVPFGGTYRLIDFALSNFANARYLKIVVLTQYKSHSLDRHIAMTWRMSPLFNNYVMSVPAQMRAGKRWFEGSADAIFQNLNLIQDERPDYICVFGSDHIYRMDPSQMVEAHIQSGAGVTVAGIRVPRAEAFRFGIIEPGDRSVNGWAGDTVGAFFNNTNSTTNSGLEVRPIFDATDPADAAVWPDYAKVPCAVGSTNPDCAGLGTDAQGDLYDAALQGGISASQGDRHMFYWEGDPSSLTFRTHPMGLAVETIVPWLGDAGRILEYGVRFTRPVVVDPQAGADVTIVAKAGAVDDDTARIDLTVTFDGATVLGKAQVRVRTA